jgi:hypothetical protein
MYARLVLCCLLLAFPARVFAEASVVVLGIRSVEGDDDVANDLTEQLRGAARGIEGWSVSSTAVSVAQMSLAHGCEELDAACLTEIAQGLQADRLIYGVARRTSARDDFDYVVTLNLFDTGTREIARTVTDTIPRSQVDFQSLSSHADRLVSRLASTSTGSAIEIRANVTDADVQINGQHVGTTHDGGLRLQGLRPGQYRIEIRKPGYAPHVSTVTMVEGADTSISAVLAALASGPPPVGLATTTSGNGEVQEASSGGIKWLGWTLLGLGAASFIGMGASFIIIEGVQNDTLFVQYRDTVDQWNKEVALPMMMDPVTDLCIPANQGETYRPAGAPTSGPMKVGFSEDEVEEVADMCQTAETFELLQWVFLSTGVVTSGVGLYIVLSSDGDSNEHASEQPTLSLRPSISPKAASLTATLRF